MPAVPLGIDSYKRSLVPEVVLKNMYVEKDKSGQSPDKLVRIQRPGLVVDKTLTGPVRALLNRVSSGARITVAGSRLYSGAQNVGAVEGVGIAPVVATQFGVFIVGGTQAYHYDATLATIAMPDDAPDTGKVQDVDQLNNYAILLQPGGRFYWIEPGENEVDPLNFATAESLPDGGVAVRRLGDEFWIFGGENIEVWQSTGDQNAPFQRAAGRNFERGCLYRDTVQRFDNTLVWVGDDAQVYRAAAAPQVISEPGISERIRKAAGECSAWTFGVEGHSFYVLRVPGQGSFAYDASTQLWSEFGSFGRTEWLPYVGYQDNGVVYAGSSLNGTVWRVDPSAETDSGRPIVPTITGTLFVNGKPPRNDSASIGVGASADCTLRLRWRDGRDDYPSAYEELLVQAPFDVAELWRLGSIDEPFRTFEISCADPVKISISGMIVNEAWA